MRSLLHQMKNPQPLLDLHPRNSQQAKHKLKSMRRSCLVPRGWPALDTTELLLARPLQTFRPAMNYIAHRQRLSIGPGDRGKRLCWPPLLTLYLLAKLGCKCYCAMEYMSRAVCARASSARRSSALRGCVFFKLSAPRACEVLLSTLTQLRRRLFQAGSWFGLGSVVAWPYILRARFS